LSLSFSMLRLPSGLENLSGLSRLTSLSIQELGIMGDGTFGQRRQRSHVTNWMQGKAVAALQPLWPLVKLQELRLRGGMSWCNTSLCRLQLGGLRVFDVSGGCLPGSKELAQLTALQLSDLRCAARSELNACSWFLGCFDVTRMSRFSSFRDHVERWPSLAVRSSVLWRSCSHLADLVTPSCPGLCALDWRNCSC
jgi:hypothetical protein